MNRTKHITQHYHQYLDEENQIRKDTVGHVVYIATIITAAYSTIHYSSRADDDATE